MSGIESARRVAPSRKAAFSELVGSEVRVVARRGYVIQGICMDIWRLRNGGTALTIKPNDGSPRREVTTVLPVVIVRSTASEAHRTA